MQSLLAAVQSKSGPFDSALGAAGEPCPPVSGRGREPGGLPHLNLERLMPAYLWQFYSTMLETISRGPAEPARATLSRIFGGSLDAPSAGGIASVLYRDPSGFGAEIWSAGSGVASSFPIIAAAHGVEPGGMLIVEEPEADVDPLRQQRLVNEIVRVALARRVALVLVTHSDYVVNGALNLIHGGIASPDDLGLYYFRRRDGSFTQVERITVDETGEAEQELFEEALDALAKGGVIWGDP